jgi:hypothetical protein
MMRKTMAMFGMLLLALGACGAAEAQSEGALPEVYQVYAGCMDGLAGQYMFSPLVRAGFFSDVAGDGGGDFVTPPQAALVARFQAQAARCQVDLRTALENMDAGLADGAAQERQLTDANELMLIDRLEDWGAYAGNRRRIEANFWRAAGAATGVAFSKQGQGALPPGPPAKARLRNPVSKV